MVLDAPVRSSALSSGAGEATRASNPAAFAATTQNRPMANTVAIRFTCIPRYPIGAAACYPCGGFQLFQNRSAFLAPSTPRAGSPAPRRSRSRHAEPDAPSGPAAMAWRPSDVAAAPARASRTDRPDRGNPAQPEVLPSYRDSGASAPHRAGCADQAPAGLRPAVPARPHAQRQIPSRVFRSPEPHAAMLPGPVLAVRPCCSTLEAENRRWQDRATRPRHPVQPVAGPRQVPVRFDHARRPPTATDAGPQLGIPDNPAGWRAP